MNNYAASHQNRGHSLPNPVSMVSGLWNQRELINQFVKREVIGRYKGSYLGIFWSFLTPLFMLAVYTFVFSVVFGARFGSGGSGSKAEFALILFCGLTTFNIFAECLGRAPMLIVGNVNYVKKVVFPLEILPVVSLGSALVQALINIAILFVGLALFLGVVNWTVIFIPLVLLPLALLCLGLSWFFASLGTFLRDIGNIVGLVIQVLMFMTPIFYPVTSIPLKFRWVFYVSPINYVVEDMRRVIIWGQMPNWQWLIVGSVVSAVVAWLGYAWFQKTRGGFADVL